MGRSVVTLRYSSALHLRKRQQKKKRKKKKTSINSWWSWYSWSRGRVGESPGIFKETPPKHHRVVSPPSSPLRVFQALFSSRSSRRCRADSAPRRPARAPRRSCRAVYSHICACSPCCIPHPPRLSDPGSRCPRKIPLRRPEALSPAWPRRGASAIRRSRRTSAGIRRAAEAEALIY